MLAVVVPDAASCNATASAATTMDVHPAVNPLKNTPTRRSPARRLTTVKMP